MNEASLMCSHQTLGDIPSAISLQESADGHTHCNLPDGQQTDLFGQAVALVSHSRLQGKAMASKTNGTCGPISLGSSKSADLSQCLANRLKERLDTVGSMEYVQTWKLKATPLGRQYWAHTASTPRTKDNGCTGWATPKVATGDYQYGKNKSKILNLTGMAKMAAWATPTGRDHKDGANVENVPENCLLGRQVHGGTRREAGEMQQGTDGRMEM